jgi:tight adherence protein B
LDAVMEVLLGLSLVSLGTGLSLWWARRMERLRQRLGGLSGATAKARQEEEAVRRQVQRRLNPGQLPSAFGWLERRARQAGVRVEFSTVLALMLGAGVGLLTVGWLLTGVPWIAALLSFLGLLAPVWYINQQAARRQRKMLAQMAQLAQGIAQGMRAGMTLRQALEAAGEMPSPLGDDVRATLRQLAVGTPLREAVSEIERGSDLDEVRILVSAMRIHLETGASLPEILDGVVKTVREREETKAQVDAITAQGRMEANVLMVLPFALLLLFRLIAPSYLNPLFRTGAGVAVFLAALGWQAVGYLVTRRLLEEAER